MVFKDDVAAEFAGKFGEDIAEDIGVLFDDAGERDDKDNSAKVVFARMAKRKTTGSGGLGMREA